jgi:hypothetical protein
MTDRREIVADYLRRGWVPFAYEGQFTPPPGWQRSQTDETTLDRISDSKTPIGLLVGKPSGIVVVDIDGRNGGDPKAFLEHYNLGPRSTRVIQSASPGSFHLYFKYPEGYDHLQKTKGERTGVDALKGVDLLADGAHVFAPPTVRVGHPEKSDGDYRVKVDAEVAELPEALLVDWLAAVTRSTPEGKPVGEIRTGDIDRVLELHKRNVEIAAEAVQGTRDDVVTGRIGSSIRIALALPDSVLSVEKVKQDFENGVPYEIKDFDGKIERAVHWAEQHAWMELVEPEGELPSGVPLDKASDYFEELGRLRVRAAAKRAFEMEELERQTAYEEVGEVLRGDAFMKNRPNKPVWVVKGLIRQDASALMAGKYKVGKSTFMLNLIKSLTTGTPFLGRFEVDKPMTVAYVDMELGDGLAWDWLRETEGIDYSKLVYMDRMGKGRRMNMRSDTLRANTARMLRENGVDVLIIDPLSPIMSSLGMDENGAETVRPLLDSFDMLKVEAELKALVVSHHTGHQDQTRARGSTAFMDWPSSYFSVVRNGEEYDSPRLFQAMGRDVLVPPAALNFDLKTRTLSLADPLAEFGMHKKDPFDSSETEPYEPPFD